MDPIACLKRLQEALKQSQYAEALAALNDYYHWRIGGGYEVIFMRRKGDAVADEAAQTLILELQAREAAE